MGIYTTQGSSQLDEKIDRDLQHIVSRLLQQPEASLWKSILLLGGYGRGEGTPLIIDDQQFPFNDYDLIVVSVPLLCCKRQQLQKKLQQQGKQLSEELGIEVDLFLHTERTLKKAEKSLMNCELREGHRVLWGEKEIAKQLPYCRMEEISPLEGTRLLMNRGTLLLYNRKALAVKREIDALAFQRCIKYIQKAYLALGDATLLLYGDYAMRSEDKRKRIEKVVEEKQDSPLNGTLMHKYLQAIAFKEWADFSCYEKGQLPTLQKEAEKDFLFFFHRHEEKRLHKKWDSLFDYCLALQEETSMVNPIKVVLQNLIFFKHKAFSPSMRWLFKHPRERLFAAFWILFKGMDSPAEEELFATLIAAKGSAEQKEKFFFQLRECLG